MSLSLSCHCIHVNVYIGYCIATVGDDRYGLGGNRFEGHVDVYMSLLFLGPILYYKHSYHSHCHLISQR